MSEAVSSRIRIRKTDDDCELLKDLNNLIFGDNCYIPNFEEGIWWIATYKDEAIGFAGLELEWDYGYLCRVGVLKSFRNRKLGKRFIQVREKEARKLGLKRLVTDTSPMNYSSMNNLISCGFKIFSPKNPWSFKTQLYWQKDL